jgi:phenylalanyl-tRNA synthetase beta chain
MKIPLSWLKEYLDLTISPTEIAKILTMAGLEVDGIETIDDESSPDAVFEISLTPNLGHCASVIGVVRELAAAIGKPIKKKSFSLKESDKSIDDFITVSIESPESCPRYACRVIKNIRVVPSPDWIQKKLVACGIRPINNVVDSTNYILIELGQPLHAFDYDLIEGNHICVRTSKTDEKFITLDEKEHILSAEDLLICDAKKPIAIAGVMGGRNTEVSDKTVNILLESAHFKPTSIRKTSKRLSIQTDASKRFERGSDPNHVINALDMAANLIQSIAGGEVAAGVIDIQKKIFYEKLIECRLTRVNQILGTHLGVGEIENIFQSLGMECKWDGQNTFTVRVQTYRFDITEEIDLIEEIARIYGYDNISRNPTTYHTSPIPHTPIFLFERELRTKFVAEGLQEFLTCDLIGPSSSDLVHESGMPAESIVKVLNPTSIEQSILRTSLLPGLLQVVKYNFDHQNKDLSGFELGRIHFKEKDRYWEQLVAGIILTGKSSPHHWQQKDQDFNFFDLKGIVENILNEVGIDNVHFKSNQLLNFHSGRQASIYVDSLEIGSLGEIHPAIVRKLDVPQRIFFAELNVNDMLQVRNTQCKMKPLPIYPGSERDWTITIDEKMEISKLLDLIKSVPSSLLENISLLDIYRSEKLGGELKNVTFRFVYRDNKKTLAQEEVDREHARITNEVQARIEAIEASSHN